VHGEATALTVRVRTEGNVAGVEVSDNGRGFDPAELPPAGHFGLRGLRDLAEEAGGRLVIDSAPGEGTRVQMEVPIQ
jgi:two-component system NarL family sensor kinase